MSISESSFIPSKSFAFRTGVVFLFGYWLFGFDGITFSDDVYYLLAGKSFWEGTMEVNAYHFSSRWGAYVPAGLMGHLLGFEPHRISLISLIAYLGTLALLLRILPKGANPWILTLWACTQVYFLHFLTKVYPDSLLVFWTVLVPFSTVFREKKPVWAALGVISGLFFGFLTKETIVFLAPLPILLFIWDWKKGNPNFRFYGWVIGLGLIFGSIYLGYFWAKFGDPFYRVSSINAGHYVSEFTYADKGTWAMVRRLTYLPILTWVERSYWLWIVFALPGMVRAWKTKRSPSIEFALTALCLIAGFWFMSSTLEFYNPIYLNPRHMIVLVPVLAFLIASGWKKWETNPNLEQVMGFLLIAGIGISLFQQDWKMAGFQLLFVFLIRIKNMSLSLLSLGLVLLVPVFASVLYQNNIKAYPNFIEKLNEEVYQPEDQSPIICNNFVYFSREVLFPDNPTAQNSLFPIEKLDSLQTLRPKEVRVLIYDYYQHAYPKEQEDVDRLERWLGDLTLEREESEGLVRIRKFKTPFK